MFCLNRGPNLPPSVRVRGAACLLVLPAGRLPLYLLLIASSIALTHSFTTAVLRATMVQSMVLVLLAALSLSSSLTAPAAFLRSRAPLLRLSSTPGEGDDMVGVDSGASSSSSFSPTIDAEMDAQEKAAKKVAELKAQEVFIKRETGIWACGTCDYKYDEAKGDMDMIGGTNPAGTPFAELPSNYRCPTCRSSKDSFTAVVEEIAGFEVNQGYGFGTNGMTGGQKNLLIFGGLGAFFVLFLSGYAMS